MTFEWLRDTKALLMCVAATAAFEAVPDSIMRKVVLRFYFKALAENQSLPYWKRHKIALALASSQVGSDRLSTWAIGCLVASFWTMGLRHKEDRTPEVCVCVRARASKA